MTALEELRENLRAAAQRQVAADRARRHRRRRRATGVVVVVALGGAAAAGATDLISLGEPVRDTRRQTSAYRPHEGGNLQLAVTADSGGELPFGVGLYTARNGDRCALVGQVRGATLGAVEAGVFRAYGAERTGPCRANGSLYDTAQIGGRTLVFGRAAAGVRAVRVSAGGEQTSARPGPGGAFLFVYDGATPRDAFVVRFS